jgi:hypothetical protein
MTSIGIDATSFNATAEKVIAKTEQLATKVQQAGTPRSVAFSRTAGLATDPAAAIAEMSGKKVASTKDKLRAAEKAAAMREAEDLKRMALAGAEARALGAKEGKNNRRFMKEAVSEEAAALGVGAKNMSALGGAAKMFAGYLTADFLISKAKSNMEYAETVTQMGKRLTASTTEVQAWDKALQLNGSSLKQVEPMLDKFNKSRIMALSGSARQMGAAKTLGLSEDQLRSMGTLDMVGLAGKALESGHNMEAVIAAMQTMGGEGAVAFVEMFQGGLGQAVQDAKESGNLMTEGMVASWKAMGDQWTTIAQTLGSGLAILLQPFVFLATELTTQILSIPKALGAVFGGMAGGFEGGSGFFGSIWESLRGGIDGFDQFTQDEAKKKSERNNAIQRAKLGIHDTKATNIDVENAKEKARAKKEEAALDKAVNSEIERQRKENAKLGAHSVNSMQAMGAFFGNAGLAAGPEVAALNAQLESRDILREMRDIMKKRKDQGATAEEF